MRNVFGITVAIFLFVAFGNAQIPSGNVFVGYSFSQTNTFGGTKSLNGWEGSLEGKFVPWVGIVADFSAAYGSDNSVSLIDCPGVGCPIASSSPTTSVRRYTYLVGPRVSIPVHRFTPFAQALFGAAHINDQGSSDTSFATAIGGGLDYRLIHGLAWRIQGDELHTNFFNVGENHFRFSTGIDVRF